MDRLRWDNIARAAAVIAVVALVVAWPRLQARAPALPPAAAKPVTVEDPALVRDPAVPTPTVEQPAPAVRKRPSAVPRERRHRRRARAPGHVRPHVRLAPRSLPSATPTIPVRPAGGRVRVPVRPPSADDVAAGEFALP